MRWMEIGQGKILLILKIMKLNPEEFINELKELFELKKPFLLEHKQRDSVFGTIKAYLQKKNLVVISYRKWSMIT
jgi:LytS/YehU family sensor histidine kinase